MKIATGTKYTAMMWAPQRSQILIFSQFCRHPNFSTKVPRMPGCHRVKFGCRQNWLKIEIWDPQATCRKVLYSVSVANPIPHPSSFVRLRAPSFIYLCFPTLPSFSPLFLLFPPLILLNCAACAAARRHLSANSPKLSSTFPSFSAPETAG